jgi:hypothetical protein
MKIAYRLLTGKHNGKKHLGQIGINERGEKADWTKLAQETDEWRALMNKVMNLRVQYYYNYQWSRTM